MDGFEELPVESISCAKDIYGLAVNAGGDFFIVGHYSTGGSEEVNLSAWSMAERKLMEEVLTGDETRYPSKLFITATDEAVVFLSEQQVVHKVGLHSGKHEKLPYEQVIDLSVSGKGLMAITAATPHLITVPSGKAYPLEKALADAAGKEPVHVSVSNDGSKLYVAGSGQAVEVYNLPGMTQSGTLANAPAAIIEAHSDRLNRYYYGRSARQSGEALWNIATGKRVLQKIFKPGSGPANPAVDFHPSLPVIATGSNDGLLMLLDMEQEKIVSMQSLGAYPVRSTCFLPDGRLLLAATGDGMVHFIDLSTLLV